MKFERKIRWQGILLCMLLANQFFGTISKRIDFQHGDPYNKKITKRFHKHNQEDTANLLRKDQCPTHPHHRVKRFVVAVLFAISIIATLANIGFDIYLQIKGCEGIFPSIRSNVDEVERIRNDLAKRSERMNQEYVASQNILEYTRSANLANLGIMGEVRRIMTITNEIMEALSPEDVIRFLNKSYDLKQELRKHNETVEKYNFLQLEQSYQGIFSNWKSALIGLAPILGIFGQLALTKVFNWYRLSKITKSVASTSGQLTASSKARQLLGVTDVNKAISTTAKAQQQGLQAASKMSKVAKVAGAAMSLVSIGLEIYVAIQKVKACEKQRDLARDALKEIKPEVKEFQKTEDELMEFKNNLTNGYNFVKGSITSAQFFGYANTIKNITDNVDNPPEKIKQASRNITTFLNQIKSADFDKTNQLQKTLDYALSSVTYTMDCLKKKIQTLTYTHRQCAKGKGSMKNIFDFALKLYRPNSFRCTSETGHEYTSFDATKTYIENRMEVENYQPDCILNSKDMKALVCSYYISEYNTTEIQEKTGLTGAQVTYFIPSCPPGEVTPVLKRRLCLMKSYFNLAAIKDLYDRYDQQQLVQIYNACPLPPMSDAVKSIICTKKKTGEPLASVRTEFNQYRTSTVDGVYNECFDRPIPADIKANICELRNKYGVSLSTVVNSFSMYTAAKVQAAYYAC